MNEASGWIGSWSPGIGDPTFFGWLTVGVYLVASWLCHRATRASHDVQGAPSTAARRLRALWSILAAVLLLLAINKQLDLQTALTELGRMSARTHGWYEYRRKFQVAFIAFVALSAVAAVGIAVRIARGLLRDVGLALLGMVLLLAFIALRASSFHQIDALLGIRLSSVSLNVLLELGGISLIGLQARRFVARSVPGHRPAGASSHASGEARQGP